ncbi:ABC transporter permease YtrF [Pseudoclavibacter triregionum]|nr:ABC transporter permease YtrF [Pseudoclavibacter triregionum]
MTGARLEADPAGDGRIGSDAVSEASGESRASETSAPGRAAPDRVEPVLVPRPSRVRDFVPDALLALCVVALALVAHVGSESAPGLDHARAWLLWPDLALIAAAILVRRRTPALALALAWGSAAVQMIGLLPPGSENLGTVVVADGALPAPVPGVSEYTWIAPSSPLPAVFAILTVWIAAYLGSRAGAKVSPVQALSASVEAPVEQATSGKGRKIAFWLLMAPGLALLLGGCAIGAATPLGVLVAFNGGVLSFTAVVVGAVFIVPRLVAWIGGLFGGSASAALARGNALRAPRATTRAVIGMIIGVALIVMFAVALATMRQIVWDYFAKEGGPSAEDLAAFDQSMAVMFTLVAVSAVLAAIGMISNLALAVIHRRRELGLLRAVGMDGSQIRSMILIESAVTAIVAIGFGAVLGILYGWAGAQSTYGSLAGGVAWPVVPWQLPIAIVIATVALALVAAIGPAARATKVTPIEALAVS